MFQPCKFVEVYGYWSRSITQHVLECPGYKNRRTRTGEQNVILSGFLSKMQDFAHSADSDISSERVVSYSFALTHVCLGVIEAMSKFEKEHSESWSVAYRVLLRLRMSRLVQIRKAVLGTLLDTLRSQAGEESGQSNIPRLIFKIAKRILTLDSKEQEIEITPTDIDTNSDIRFLLQSIFEIGRDHFLFQYLDLPMRGQSNDIPSAPRSPVESVSILPERSHIPIRLPSVSRSRTASPTNSYFSPRRSEKFESPRRSEKFESPRQYENFESPLGSTFQKNASPISIHYNSPSIGDADINQVFKNARTSPLQYTELPENKQDWAPSYQNSPSVKVQTIDQVFESAHASPLRHTEQTEGKHDQISDNRNSPSINMYDTIDQIFERAQTSPVQYIEQPDDIQEVLPNFDQVSEAAQVSQRQNVEHSETPSEIDDTFQIDKGEGTQLIQSIYKYLDTTEMPEQEKESVNHIVHASPERHPSSLKVDIIGFTDFTDILEQLTTPTKEMQAYLDSQLSSATHTASPTSRKSVSPTKSPVPAKTRAAQPSKSKEEENESLPDLSRYLTDEFLSRIGDRTNDQSWAQQRNPGKVDQTSRTTSPNFSARMDSLHLREAASSPPVLEDSSLFLDRSKIERPAVQESAQGVVKIPPDDANRPSNQAVVNVQTDSNDQPSIQHDSTCLKLEDLATPEKNKEFSYPISNIPVSSRPPRPKQSFGQQTNTLKSPKKVSIQVETDRAEDQSRLVVLERSLENSPMIRSDLRSVIQEILNNIEYSPRKTMNKNKLHPILKKVFDLDPVLLVDLCSGFTLENEDSFDNRYASIPSHWLY